MDREGHRLANENVHGTEYLTVDGDLKHLLNGTGLKKREQVKTLRLFGDLDEFRGGRDGGDSDEEYDSHGEKLRLKHLMAFPRMLFPLDCGPELNSDSSFISQVSTRSCLGKVLSLWTSERTLPLPQLRRLVIYGEVEIEDDESNPPTFSPANTPNLTSLALDETDLDYQGFNYTFSGIFDQISTLAIQDFGKGLRKRSSLNYLDKLRNLSHLSIDIGRCIKQALLRLKGLHLESLHLSLRQLQEEEEPADFLLDIIDGKLRGIRIDRIHIYESQVASLEGIQGRMEWRDDQDSPPFEDFDGR